MQWDCLWVDANIATFSDSKNPYGASQNAAIAVKDGLIAWVGPQSELPEHCAKKTISINHAWITPGLIDCHTHLVYAGNRSHEFAKRLAGMSYADIARAGGGIRATVTATRAASVESLYQESLPRLRALMSEGVTTVEIKSGYGLNLESEINMLHVAKRFANELPITVKTSFLGAHALPSEFSNNDDYVAYICDVMLPEIARLGLVDAVDGFCESIGFTYKQIEKVFLKAQSLNLPLKLHAEQLSDQQGAKLAANFKALSADHLEYVSEVSVKAMAESGTVAVLLPGAFYYLQETQKPPIDLFREYKVPIAIATDCNPGSSPCTSLLLMLNMACTLFKLAPEEALLGVTQHAAKALGISNSHGAISIGKNADFVIWDIQSPDELCYCFGFNPCLQVIKGGVVHDNQYTFRPESKNFCAERHAITL